MRSPGTRDTTTLTINMAEEILLRNEIKYNIL